MFAAIGALLVVRGLALMCRNCRVNYFQATEGVSKRYSALEELFDQIPFLIDSARVQLASPRDWGFASRNVAVAIFVHLLDVFSLALKFMTTVFGGTFWIRLSKFRSVAPKS